MSSLSVANDVIRASSPPRKTQFVPEVPSTPPNKSQNPVAAGTPFVKNENSSKATAENNDVASRYMRLAEEIQHNLLGPMPVTTFFKRFLPQAGKLNKMPKVAGAFDGVPDGNGEKIPNEKILNEPIAEALNKDNHGNIRCPGINFFHTGDRNENRHGSKIDICGYTEGYGENKTMPDSVQTFVEIKLGDFACDEPGPDKEFLFGHIENDKELKFAKAGLGQQVAYATEICERQHRNFLFSIFMTPTHARFLRWDRAGVIISASFDYRQQARLLCEFLWRFGNMTDEERGCDTTVQMANETEEKTFAEAIKAHVKAQLGDDYMELEEECLRHYQPGTVNKIPVRKRMQVQPKKAPVGDGSQEEEEEIVTFDESEKEVEFLVSRPVVSPASLASRATRGYWAVHVEEKTVHFLKDAWRTDVKRMTVEGRILEKLNIGQVENIPTLVCWSDVCPRDKIGYSTETDRYNDSTEHEWNKHWRKGKKRLTHRIHYRQVIKEAGYTLEQLSGTRELLKGAFDVFHAIRDAHTKCGLLHRDVSSSNIILFANGVRQYSDRKGILVDWEFSCEDKASEARDHWISGTWPFMSVNSLRNYRRHHVCDDVESLIYVVFYCAVHLLPWTKYDSEAHAAINHRFFDAHYDGDGGEAKFINAFNGDYFSRAQFECVSPWLMSTLPILRNWLNKVEPDLPAKVIALYSPIFDEILAMELQPGNREVHERSYKGRRKDLNPATSTTHSSLTRLSDQPPLLPNHSGASKKRSLKSVEGYEPPESLSKRRRTDEAEGDAIAGPSNTGNSSQQLRRSSRLSANQKQG